MEKNKKILRLLLVFLIALAGAVIFYIYRPPASDDRANITIPDSGARSDSTVKYRIDDSYTPAHQVYLTVTLNTAANQNGTTPNFSLPEVQLNNTATNFIVYSPYTSWNGTDSLITTFKLRVVVGGTTIIKTGTERILCPNKSVTNAYFYKPSSTSTQFWRISNGSTETPTTFFPKISANPVDPNSIIVSWPPP